MKRISEQFKVIMQPYYRSGRITKDEYKDVMRKAVPAVRYFFISFYVPYIHISCLHVDATYDVQGRSSTDCHCH